jgi:hypothetical protein
MACTSRTPVQPKDKRPGNRFLQGAVAYNETMKEKPATPLLELLANVKKAERNKHAKLANKRADPQNRWVRFNHYVWDKRRGEG